MHFYSALVLVVYLLRCIEKNYKNLKEIRDILTWFIIDWIENFFTASPKPHLFLNERLLLEHHIYNLVWEYSHNNVQLYLYLIQASLDLITHTQSEYSVQH